MTCLFTVHSTADGVKEKPLISSVTLRGHRSRKVQLAFGADSPSVAHYRSIVQTLNGHFRPSFHVCLYAFWWGQPVIRRVEQTLCNQAGHTHR